MGARSSSDSVPGEVYCIFIFLCWGGLLMSQNLHLVLSWKGCEDCYFFYHWLTMTQTCSNLVKHLRSARLVGSDCSCLVLEPISLTRRRCGVDRSNLICDIFMLESRRHVLTHISSTIYSMPGLCWRHIHSNVFSHLLCSAKLSLLLRLDIY